MSDLDLLNAMKRTLFSPLYGRRLGKSLVVSTLLLSLGATFSVQSAIRILGPQKESPPPSTAQPLSQSNNQPASTANRRQSVGPTQESDTLWSIATRYKPNNAVSVYQTLGAIFRLNPNAFENANIHGLIPGSTLLMPTLTEIRRESTDDVARRLQIDQARKDALQATNAPLAAQVTPPAQPKPAPAPNPKPAETASEKTAVDMANAKEAANEDMANAEGMKGSMPPKPDMSDVQAQINESDLQMGKLFESNHILKIRLAEVQNELVALKDQMSADEELTEEIRKFLEMQRARQAQMEMKEPSFMESLMASPLMLAILAIIPALLVIGAAAFFIMRRRKEEDDEVEAPEGLDQADPDMPVIMVPEVEEGTDELVLEDDDLEVTDDMDVDELFGDELMESGIDEIDDIDLSDSLELSDDMEEGGLDLDAEIDPTSALDASLDDDFGSELDVEASTDGAIGLEDMERALDEMSQQPQDTELSPDEALAAMWEQSLSGGGEDVDDIDALLAAEQDTPEEPVEETDAVSELEELVAPQEDEAEPQADEALFNKLMDDEPELDLSQDIDLSDDDIDDLIDPVAAQSQETANEEELDDPTDLLDEFLNEQDETLTDTSDADEVLTDPDALLEELLEDELLDDDGNPIESAPEDDTDSLALPDVDNDDLADSDALLDEFVEDDDSDPLDESALLDAAIDEDDILDELVESQDDEDIDLAETDILLDELVGEEEEDTFDESTLLGDLENEELDEDALIGFDEEIDAESDTELAELETLIDEDDAQDALAFEPGVDTENGDSISAESDEEALIPEETGAEENVLDELESLLEENDEPQPIDAEATESELDLLDEVLEQDAELDDADDVSANSANLEPDVAPEPEATQEAQDLLDSLLDEVDAENAQPKEIQSEMPDNVAEASSGESELDALLTEAELTKNNEQDSAEEAQESVLAETETAIEPEPLSSDDVEENEPLDLSSLPEYDEASALADSADEPYDGSDTSDTEAQDAEDLVLDLDDLPEYTEEDAQAEFNAFPEENGEAETEEVALTEDVDSPVAEQEQPAEAFEQEAMDAEEESFVATDSNTLAFPEVEPIDLEDIGDFDEDDALSAALEEQRELEEFLPQEKRGEFKQHSAPVSQGPYRAAELDGLAELEDDDHQVAGLNMEALLSEPLDEDEYGLGDFETEALDIPKEETDVWSAELEPEPELASEDWSEQPEVLGDDIKSMDLDAELEGLLEGAESELVEESNSEDRYISIDDLMKDDGEPQEDPDSLKMDLNVGLEDFPDVLSDIQPTDVDSSGEAALNMDLAKAYLEMNDVDGALQLLEKVMQGDDNQLKAEARQMIEHLN